MLSAKPEIVFSLLASCLVSDSTNVIWFLRRVTARLNGEEMFESVVTSTKIKLKLFRKSQKYSQKKIEKSVLSLTEALCIISSKLLISASSSFTLAAICPLQKSMYCIDLRALQRKNKKSNEDLYLKLDSVSSKSNWRSSDRFGCDRNAPLGTLTKIKYSYFLI